MRLYLIFIYLFLGACSTLPPAFDDEMTKGISYRQVSADLDSYQDATVRWGGVIVDVEDDEEFSWMQVSYYPLDYYGRPVSNKPSEGRFVIKSDKFHEVTPYEADREIIVVGVVDGKIERKIGDKYLHLPLIRATAIHLWPINYRGDYYDYCRSCYYRQLFW